MTRWHRKGKTKQELRNPPPAFSCTMYVGGAIVKLPSADERTLETDNLSIEIRTRTGDKVSVSCSLSCDKPQLVIRTGRAKGWSDKTLYSDAFPITPEKMMRAFSAYLSEKLADN